MAHIPVLILFHWICEYKINHFSYTWPQLYYHARFARAQSTCMTFSSGARCNPWCCVCILCDTPSTHEATWCGNNILQTSVPSALAHASTHMRHRWATTHQHHMCGGRIGRSPDNYAFYPRWRWFDLWLAHGIILFPAFNAYSITCILLMKMTNRGMAKNRRNTALSFI